jgi:hypothetical protein
MSSRSEIFVESTVLGEILQVENLDDVDSKPEDGANRNVQRIKKELLSKKRKQKLQHSRGADMQQQDFFLKRLILAKLHSNKTTPNGLGRMDCSVLD